LRIPRNDPHENKSPICAKPLQVISRISSYWNQQTLWFALIRSFNGGDEWPDAAIVAPSLLFANICA